MNISDSDFEQVRAFMLKQYGINLEKKRSLIEGRLSQLVEENGCDSFRDYVSAAMTNPKLQQQMVTRLTTNYTYFQREEVHFNYMVKEAVPAMLADNPHKRSLKLWSAGCSSGDEPYTISIFLREMMAAGSPISMYSIQATDISDDMLQHAQQGCYTEDNLKTLSPALRAKYLTPAGEGEWKLSPLVAAPIRFSKLNLMQPFPIGFQRFDIIFCRNVMIYFTQETRKELTQKFYDALNPGGYLFIGLSENIPGAKVGFQMMRPSVFQKARV